MVIDNTNTKKLLNAIFIVLLLLCVCISIDYAANDTIIANENMTVDPKINATNATIINGTYYSVEKDHGVAKLNKVVTEKPKLPLVSIVSKPSCGCRYSYTWHKRTFINYCPHCHKYNTLRNVHKWPARHEQELTCDTRLGGCGADYCGCCGKEKYSWSRVYLRKA